MKEIEQQPTEQYNHKFLTMCITREIPNTGGYYFADEDGNIYSVYRDNRITGGEIKTGNSTGYRNVSLAYSGIKSTRLVHILIAQTFIPNPLNLPQVNHKNGNKADNRKINLEWSTPKQNMRHSYDNLGLITSKLLSADIYELYNHLKNKGSRVTFAKDKNVSRQAISDIVTGKTWQHLNIDWSPFKNKSWNRKKKNL